MAQAHGWFSRSSRSVIEGTPFSGDGMPSPGIGQTRGGPQDAGLGVRLGMSPHIRTIVAACLMVVLLAGIGIAVSFGSSGGFRVERTEMGGGTAADRAGDSEDSAHGLEGMDADDDGEVTAEVIVHVDGAVAHPGLYRVTGASARVGDAVDQAGGLTDAADTTLINLAEPLVDGMKVHVYARGETVEVASAASSLPAHPTSGLININVASAAELESLPGFGEVTAKAIVSDREQHGSFASVDELVRVSGVGERRLAQIRELVCV